MDFLTVVTGAAALVAVAAILVATIHVLAGATEDTGLALLFAPLVKGVAPDPGPVVPEPEPTPWHFEELTPRPKAPSGIVTPPRAPQPIRSATGYAHP